MPIYEYACKRCGNFEIMQRITEDPLKKCPTCGAKVAKLISQSAFHLKGSGWYSTDYARNGSSSSKTEESKPTASETKENGTASKSSSSSSSTSTAKESKETPTVA